MHPQVRRQIEFVALSVKQGSQVRLLHTYHPEALLLPREILIKHFIKHPSFIPPPTHTQISDMRRHQFRGRLQGAQVVFLRAQRGGACDYVNDGRWAGLT